MRSARYGPAVMLIAALLGRAEGVRAQACDPDVQLPLTGLERGDQAGTGVRIDGDTLAFVVPGDDTGASNVGMIEIWIHDGSGWAREAQIHPYLPDIRGYVGVIALDGDTLAATIHVNGIATVSTGVAVYHRVAGTWSQQAILQASAGEWDDRFGVSAGEALDLDGDLLVAGAWQDDEAGPDAGAAYVFARSGATWTEEAKLLASDATDFERWGEAVAISGETVVVGVARTSAGGRVHTFERRGGTWPELDILRPVALRGNARFGCSLAIEDQRLLVGSEEDDNVSTPGPGSAWTFTRDGDGWLQEARFTPPGAVNGDRWGLPVRLSGCVIVITSDVDATCGVGTGSGAGSHALYHLVGGAWTYVEKMCPPDMAASEENGLADVSGGHIILGAPARAIGSELGAGAVYVRECPPPSPCSVGDPDGDGDGWPDAVDCNPTNPGDAQPASEATDLRVTRAGADTSLLAWTAPALHFDDLADARHGVLRGVLSELRADRSLARACRVTNAAAAWTDASPPPAHDGFWYLVLGLNDCGAGDPGTSSPPTLDVRAAVAWSSLPDCP